MTNPTILTQIKIIMKDWCWHGCDDFISIGLSYRNRLSEWGLMLAAQAHPICIASKLERGRSTFKYKLARRDDCRLVAMQNGSRWEIREGTQSMQEGVNLR